MCCVSVSVPVCACLSVPVRVSVCLGQAYCVTSRRWPRFTSVFRRAWSTWWPARGVKSCIRLWPRVCSTASALSAPMRRPTHCKRRAGRKPPLHARHRHRRIHLQHHTNKARLSRRHLAYRPTDTQTHRHQAESHRYTHTHIDTPHKLTSLFRSATPICGRLSIPAHPAPGSSRPASVARVSRSRRQEPGNHFALCRAQRGRQRVCTRQVQ